MPERNWDPQAPVRTTVNEIPVHLLNKSRSLSLEEDSADPSDYGHEHHESGSHTLHGHAMLEELPYCAGDSLSCYLSTSAEARKNPSVEYHEKSLRCLPQCVDQTYEVRVDAK